LGFLALLRCRTLAQAEEPLPPWEPVETHFGEISVRQFGPEEGPLVVLVHGMMDNDYIRNEWNPVAQKLAENDFHVIVPDFHSAPTMLQPDVLVQDDFKELLLNSFLPRNRMVPARYHSSVKPKALVMGKSWGARMAAEAGDMEQVVGVGLVVPALDGSDGEVLPRIKGDIAVCLAKDDPVVNYAKASESIRSALKDRKVTWVEATKGGHAVLGDFVGPLVAFAEALRPAFVHGGDAAPEEL